MSKPVRRPTTAQRYSRAALLVIAMLIPALSLVPLGTLWLWEHGYVIYWAIGTCLAVIGLYLLQTRLIVPLPPEAMAADADPDADPGSVEWSPRQAEAWADVTRLAAAVSPERLSSRDAALDLGLQTIETVAHRLHPERGDPLLQFTVPEALAVIERASGSLRDLVISSFPLGDRITVAQLMWLYRWRGALGLVEKGYDLWRIVRLLNPASAVTQELRERFTKQIYEMGRDHLARRLARAYVKEVGRAAIDLYGGSLRVTGARLAAHVTDSSRTDMARMEAREAEPVRILVAGQSGAGKSSLVNALANAVEAAVDPVGSVTTHTTAYRLTHDGIPAALLVDTPGVVDGGDLAPLIDAADDCDMILWVSSAARAARAPDARALAAIRAHFAARPDRRRPPMLLILTHIDALRPFAEWSPPYALAADATGKAASIRAALAAASGELGFAEADAVPVRIDIAVAPYNVDAVWARIIALMPDAQRARLLRTLSDIRSAASWADVWSQAVNAGRVVRDTFLTRSPPP